MRREKGVRQGIFFWFVVSRAPGGAGHRWRVIAGVSGAVAAAPAWLPRAMRVRGDGVASRARRATSRAWRARRHPERAAREGLPRANRFVSDYRARTLTWAPVLTWETSAATPGVPAISYRESSVTRGFCGGGKGRKVNVGCARSGRIAHRSPEGFGEM